MTDYFKATRPDGTSFYDGATRWRVGRITRVVRTPGAQLCRPGVLHASDAPGETLLGGSWPCRLFRVEARSPIVASEGHKHAAHAWKAVEELPAWEALGPMGEHVAALIDRAGRLTAGEAQRLSAAWDAARVAAWDAAWDAARDAALGLVVWDLAHPGSPHGWTPEVRARLVQPWADVIGLPEGLP